MPEAKLRPDYTESDGSHDLAPGDFATIYDVNNVYNLGYDGAGVTIAIVGRTHPRRQPSGTPSAPPLDSLTIPPSSQ